MAWTTPTRYPNSAEIADNEGFLNTNVIDNLVNHQERIVTLESGGGGSSFVGCQVNVCLDFAITASYLNSPANYVEFSAPSFDTSSMFDATTSTTRKRIIIPTTGKYLLALENLPVYIDNAADFSSAFHIFTTASGSTLATVSRYGYSTKRTLSTGENFGASMSAVALLTAGQSVAVGVAAAFVGSGTTKNVIAMGSTPNTQYHGGFSVIAL
jgi:hypothetical protein